MKHRRVSILLLLVLMMCQLIAPARATASDYTSTKINGHSANYVTIDWSEGIRSDMMLANNSIHSAQSVADMAKTNGAFAAINGTYFSAYDGYPVPWGTIITNGRVIHTGGGAVAGLTGDGKLIVDRLSFSFKGYVNGKLRFYPWRMNHLSTEPEAITIFTPEFTGEITMQPGALAPVVDSTGKVIKMAESSVTVPKGGFVIAFNKGVAYLARERVKVGDTVTYKVGIDTTFSNVSDWDKVTTAVGAGPSLIINGQVTANGKAEGFTEAKINVNRASRSFIGSTANGKIIFGNIANATLKEAAAVCQSLSLVNAMCLDGGGSVGLYYEGSKAAGRNVNNAIGFFRTNGVSQPQVDTHVTAYGRSQELVLNGQVIKLQAYNINGNNYFKLRDLAWLLTDTKARFSVGYDDATKTVTLTGGYRYEAVGGEGQLLPEETKKVQPSSCKLIVDYFQREMTAYNINGNNYFKLRDLGKMLDFGITYDEQLKRIIVDPNVGYTE